MNFSEYTLISLGDSFTFGQDTIPDPKKRSGEDSLTFGRRWKNGCNKLSYTARITERMEFKYNVNFGVMGGNNENSLTILESFLRNNIGMKIFVLFNFTGAGRMTNLFQVPGQKVYHKQNLVPHHAVRVEKIKAYDISSKDVANYYTLWNNSMQEVYNHIGHRRRLQHILSFYKTPYISFDIVNNTDYLINRDNPLRYVGPQHQFNIDGYCFEDIYADDRFNFPEFDYMKSYIDNVINRVPPLPNHITMGDMNGSRNLLQYMSEKAMSEGLKRNHYYAKEKENDGHWTEDGHIIVTELMQKKINERYN